MNDDLRVIALKTDIMNAIQKASLPMTVVQLVVMEVQHNVNTLTESALKKAAKEEQENESRRADNSDDAGPVDPQ